MEKKFFKNSFRNRIYFPFYQRFKRFTRKTFVITPKTHSPRITFLFLGYLELTFETLFPLSNNSMDFDI
jgi:hypothetical protein